MNCSIRARRIHKEEARRNEIKKTLLYSTATIEQLKDWQEHEYDEDTLTFDSTEQMMEHLWEDYSVLKAKKKDSKRAKKSTLKNSKDLPDVPEGTKVYKFAGITAKFKRKSLTL